MKCMWFCFITQHSIQGDLFESFEQKNSKMSSPRSGNKSKNNIIKKQKIVT